MSALPVTPARALALKREAAGMKLQLGIKQSAALDRIAQREGYRSWVVLVAKAGGAEAVREAKFDEPPSEAQVQRAERSAARQLKYGSHA